MLFVEKRVTKSHGRLKDVVVVVPDDRAKEVLQAAWCAWRESDLATPLVTMYAADIARGIGLSLRCAVATEEIARCARALYEHWCERGARESDAPYVIADTLNLVRGVG